MATTPVQFDVSEFFSYFKTQDTLEVQAYRGMQIKNIGFLQVEKEITNELCTSSKLAEVFHELNRILSLTGKTLKVPSFSPGKKFSVKIGKSFMLVFQENCTLTSTKTDIVIKVSDVARIAFGLKLTAIPFTPSQSLRIEGVNKNSIASYDRSCTFSVLSDCFPTHRCCVKTFNKLQGNLTENTFALTTGIDNELLFHNYTYECEEFQWRMVNKGTIVIPANQLFCIEDDAIGEICDFYEKLEKDPGVKKNLPQFFLNQLILPESYTVAIHSLDGISGYVDSKTKGVESEEDKKSFEMSSNHGLILKKTNDPVFVRLDFLTAKILEMRAFKFSLAANQPLKLYISDFQFVEECLSKQISMASVGQKLFRDETPFGFEWKFSSGSDITYEFQKHNGQDGKLLYYTFNIASKGPLLFELQSSSLEVISKQIIKNSSKDFQSKLAAADQAAMVFLAVQVMHYCCCCSLRTYPKNELTKIFKEETLTKISKLTEDETFEAAFHEICIKKALNHRMADIQESFEKYSSMDLTQEAKSIQIVMKALMDLAYEEMQGGTKFFEFIKMVISEIDEK